MESTLYEFGFHLHWYDLFKCLAFILPVLIWLFSGAFDSHRWAELILKALSFCLALFIVWTLYLIPVVEYHTIKQAIEDGNVFIIEGEVSNLDTPNSSFGGHVTESFNIKDVFFSYSGTENYGYCNLRCNNGIVKENGQKLKIVYYNNSNTGLNIICAVYEIA